jgi:hypothetical protein
LQVLKDEGLADSLTDALATVSILTIQGPRDRLK